MYLQDSPRRRQSLHHLLHRARKLGHGAERRERQHADERQIRSRHLAVHHKPHAGRQNGKPAESHHRLHEADLECLGLLEAHQITGVVPALFGKLLVAGVAAPEGGDLPHPLDAVHHVGVNVAHPPANLVAQSFDARVGEERADSDQREERRQNDGYRP